MTSAGRRSAKDRALSLLGHRSRSRVELERRLIRAGYEQDEVTTALDDLEAVGLIDDQRFARELAAHEMQRRGAGRRLAIASLRKAGVTADLAERTVEEMAPDDEEARAEEVARERLGRLRGLDEATAHRRLVSFLLRRGYDGSLARLASRRALAGAASDADSEPLPT